MQLRELLQLIDDVAVREGISTPYLVGGVPRGKILKTGHDTKINDLDITTGNKQVSNLAQVVGIELRKHMVVATKQAKDGHISLYTKYLKIDFSSNFLVPNIDQILDQMGIKQQSDMLKELYSRDFTCNTLLMTIDLKKIKDLTGKAMKDIENKIIRTCLTPELTFKYNTNRIARVLYLSAKLDFNVDPQIIEWVKANPRYILKSEPSYNAKNIEKALMFDPAKTVQLITEMNLWSYIPITENLKPYYNKQEVSEMLHV